MSHTAIATPDMPNFPADHYAATPELHLMGGNAAVAAGYLGVELSAKDGYLEADCLPTYLCTEVTTAEPKQTKLGKYMHDVNNMPQQAVIETAPITAGKPEIKGTVEPRFSHAAVIAAMVARGKSFTRQGLHA